MTDDPVVALQRYVAHSRDYFENALIALQSGEAGKAGKLLWGSVAEVVQAVAASRNRLLRTHRELKNFVIQLARELNDESIEKDFIVAESLHHNFYEVQQERVDIEIVVPTVRGLVNKLLSLIPGEVLQKPGPA
jgi:hypothetical protein